MRIIWLLTITALIFLLAMISFSSGGGVAVHALRWFEMETWKLVIWSTLKKKSVIPYTVKKFKATRMCGKDGFTLENPFVTELLLYVLNV